MAKDAYNKAERLLLFISRAGDDKKWAEWAGWHLEAAVKHGYSPPKVARRGAIESGYLP
ncbi:MAG: hypothetical protein HQL69_07275 [Magnetococcales bacterium]|nr:hypothetical protein [Magnetococcales bacterium]